MKKLLILTLALAMAFAVTGCTATTQNNDATQPVIETQAQTQAETQAQTQAETVAQSQESDSDNIGEEKAKQIALDHAKLSESDVTALFVELDYDDGTLRYEVDFHRGGYEYDYDIDAKTGKILSYDKDIDD